MHGLITRNLHTKLTVLSNRLFFADLETLSLRGNEIVFALGHCVLEVGRGRRGSLSPTIEDGEEEVEEER